MIVKPAIKPIVVPTCVVESPSSGPRRRGKTCFGGLRGRHQDCADAARQGSPTLKDPFEMTMAVDLASSAAVVLA